MNLRNSAARRGKREKEESFMKIKWKNQQKHFAGRLTGTFLVFALALGMVVVTPGLDGAAKAVDLTGKCTLTVAPIATDVNNVEMAEDLAKADIVVDLYKVANAETVNGYDTYTYQFLNGYEKLADIYQADQNNADWRNMAQEAAKYVRDNGSNVELVKSGEAMNQAIGDLDSGLYLLIARGKDIEDYWTEVEEADGDLTAETEGETHKNIATIAQSDRYVYTYLPELISLPGKESLSGNENPSTADGGAWLYNMSVNLKPQQDHRYGSLEIVKTLLRYDVKSPATFVFEVTATLGDDTVFRDNVSLTFTSGDSTSEKSVVLKDRIPIGAQVTVEEIYSGAAYVLTSSPIQTATIEANNMVSVAFTNDYNGTNRGGGSVSNYFNQTEEGWHLQQTYDNGTVVEQGE